jgi:hypothetical protein
VQEQHGQEAQCRPMPLVTTFIQTLLQSPSTKMSMSLYSQMPQSLHRLLVEARRLRLGVDLL